MSRRSSASAAIQDAEGLVQTDSLGVLSQEARADAMERSRPRQCARLARRRHAKHPMEELSRAPFERLGGATREREQQDALRIGAIRDQMRGATRERARLAGAGAGNDQQRSAVICRGADAMLHREALLRVQRSEVVGDVRCRCRKFRDGWRPVVEHRVTGSEVGKHATFPLKRGGERSFDRRITPIFAR